jgi:hypothetical protein
MNDLHVQLSELLEKRQEIDEKIGALRLNASVELEAMRARVAEMYACLNIKPPTPAVEIASTEQPDEFDGMGPEESDEDTTYSGFVGELKALRDYNMSKRRRRA